MSYSQTPERLAYETRCREVTELRLREALPKTLWTPLGSLYVTTKQKVLCGCRCGKQYAVRARELLDGKSMSCRSCSSKLKMLNRPRDERVRTAKLASDAALIALATKAHPYKDKYGVKEYQIVKGILSGAKQRCSNPNCIGYSNYGGRGIEFKFPTLKSAIEWVLDNLGAKPSTLHSIDRIDNNRGYEAGNLRWATRTEQARNKRVYKRTKNGERIRELKEQRPDLTYETLRLWIAQGVTDDEILNRRKYARTSV